MAYFATYYELYWVLSDEQQALLFRLGPGQFDDDRGAWGLALAGTYALRGDQAHARAYADSARIAMEEQLRSTPEDAGLHVYMGTALAYLGRKAQAIAEGERGVALMPVRLNATNGPYFQHQLARIYILVGEPEKALDQLEPLLKIPYYLSPGVAQDRPCVRPAARQPSLPETGGRHAMKPELRELIQAALADRYTLDRDLGRGGMASVVLAQDLQLNRQVALKVLHAELASTVGADRFKREIRVAARLQHPNILSILDSGETPSGQLWFTMPFVEGENVYERLQREHQFAPAEALRIALATASALAYAHEQGVVHRDIKPDNILLSGDQVLVADFGVARAVSEVAEKLTATGMIVGHADLHEPRAGERRQGDRRPLRHLRARLRAVRDAGGRAAVQGPEPAGDAHAAVHGAAPAAPADGADSRARGSRDRPLARQGSGRAVRDGRRVRGGAGGSRRRRAAADAGGAAAPTAAAAPAAPARRAAPAVLVAGVGLAGAAAYLLGSSSDLPSAGPRLYLAVPRTLASDRFLCLPRAGTSSSACT